ncbi:MAG: hypothetical protein MUE69_30175 [Myxococcota bacterium]|nr:hypothetical protein [Myxococcota bacterium]
MRAVEADATAGAEREETGASVDAHATGRELPSWFVLFSPDWMPFVTLGYRAERIWRKGGLFASAPLLDDPPSLLHGVTGSLILPVVASGHPRSKLRVALGLGVGVDFAMRRGLFLTLPRAYEPGREPEPRPETQRVVAIQVHAQLGLILRAAPRGRGFLGSLLWLPTSRNLRYAVTEIPRARDRVRTVARARLTLGWVHDHLNAALFAGFAQSGSEEYPRLGGRERALEVGLQAGSGW